MVVSDQLHAPAAFRIPNFQWIMLPPSSGWNVGILTTTLHGVTDQMATTWIIALKTWSLAEMKLHTTIHTSALHVSDANTMELASFRHSISRATVQKRSSRNYFTHYIYTYIHITAVPRVNKHFNVVFCHEYRLQEITQNSHTGYLTK
jgi:hypothetical protein